MHGTVAGKRYSGKSRQRWEKDNIDMYTISWNTESSKHIAEDSHQWLAQIYIKETKREGV